MESRKMKKGRLEVICGSMFSGKTEELMRRLKRAEYARQNILPIKHKFDKRRSRINISSHDGRERAAFPIDGKSVALNKILELANSNIDVVGIDEIQFFHSDIINIICQLVEQGKRIIVAGLDLDFRGEPFGIIPTLLSVADDVTKLKAICVVCSKEAYHTQRIIDGKPAKYDTQTIMVGAEDFYEARCRDCFSIDKNPYLSKIFIQKKQKQTST
jgi:thymidine kinase